MYTRQTEIRHMTSADVYALAVILDHTESWKKLMRVIPKDLDGPAERTVGKYTSDHLKLIENASGRQNRSCTEILIEEWGTSGKRRPTVWDLRELLVRADLYRAADYVSIHFLNEPPPPRPLTGPAARIDISLPLFDTEEMQQVEGELENMTYPETSAIQRNAVVRTNLNNEDFFEKCRPCKGKVCVEKSDMIQFSLQGEACTKLCEDANPASIESDMIKFSSATISLAPIPSISTLLNDSGASKLRHTDALKSNQSSSEPTSNDSTGSGSSKADIPAISTLLVDSSTSIQNRSTLEMDSSSGGSDSECTEEIHSSLNNIPMLSALHGTSMNKSNRNDGSKLNVDDSPVNLPNLSALNLGSESKEYETENNEIVSARNFNLPNLSAIANGVEANKVYISNANIPNLSIIVGSQEGDIVRDINANVSNLSDNVDASCRNANIPNLSIIGNDMESTISGASDNFQPNISIFNDLHDGSIGNNISGVKPDKLETSQKSASNNNESEAYLPQLSLLQQ